MTDTTAFARGFEEVHGYVKGVKGRGEDHATVFGTEEDDEMELELDYITRTLHMPDNRLVELHGFDDAHVDATGENSGYDQIYVDLADGDYTLDQVSGEHAVSFSNGVDITDKLSGFEYAEGNPDGTGSEVRLALDAIDDQPGYEDMDDTDVVVPVAQGGPALSGGAVSYNSNESLVTVSLLDPATAPKVHFDLNDDQFGDAIITAKSDYDDETKVFSSFNLAVEAVNDPPTDINLLNDQVAENEPTGSLVGTLNTADVDDEPPFAYALVAGTGDDDNASFTIVGDELQTAETFDYETKSSYTIRVQTTDAGGLSYQDVFAVTVSDVNEPPVVDPAQSLSILEDAGVGTVVGVATATDPESDPLQNWTITGGNQDGVFAINDASGEISVADATNLDYETTTSYALQVTVSDGPLTSAAETVTIEVLPVNEHDPVITSSLTVEVPEGTTPVMQVTASDDDLPPESLIFSITGGADGSHFSIDLNTGQLDFLTPPDYEYPTDADGDNVYLVEVTVDDQNGRTSSETLTVTATDAEVVMIYANDGWASENGPQTGELVVSRDSATGQPLTVNYSVTGTATNGTDYETLTGSVTLAADEWYATITVTPIDDALGEGDETLEVELSTAPDYVIQGDHSAATVTIMDDEPAISIYVSEMWSSENGLVPGELTFVNTGRTDQAVTVYYTVSGTAAAGTDYETLFGSVTIPEEETTATVAVIPIDDLLSEGDETVEVELSARTEYSIDPYLNLATVVIGDDEVASVSVVATDAEASEEGPDTGTFTVSRTGLTDQPLIVNYTVTGDATEGIDYEALLGTVTIPIGQSDAPITVTPVDDAEGEWAEGVVVYLSLGGDYSIDDSAWTDAVAISDNEPVVRVEAIDVYADEEELDLGVFTVSRTGPTAQPLTVYYTLAGSAVEGTDYQHYPITDSVTIPIGLSSASVTVTPIDDLDAEGAETVQLLLSGDTPYTLDEEFFAATVIIRDNEPSTNNPPMGIPASVSTTEDCPAAFTLTGDDGDDDVEQTLWFYVWDSPEHGAVDLDPETGAAVYTPDEEYVGPDSFRFCLVDDETAGTPGPLTSQPVEVSITVAVGGPSLKEFFGSRGAPEIFPALLVGALHTLFGEARELRFFAMIDCRSLEMASFAEKLRNPPVECSRSSHRVLAGVLFMATASQTIPS